MKNMTFKVINNLFVVVYGPLNPTDEEWYGYMAAVRKAGIDRTVQLIVTEGGGPTSTQRKFLNELLGGAQVPVAVLTTSVTVRGIITALGWFNRGIRGFSPSDLRGALAHLNVSPFEHERVATTIKTMSGEIAGLQRAAG